MTDKQKRIHDLGASREQLLHILTRLQEISGASYIDQETAELVASELGMPLSRVYEAITFYDMLSDTPRGKYVVEVCDSPPCHYARGLVVAETLERLLGVSMGETTQDGKFTLKWVPCVGACDIGPVMKIHGQVFGNLTEGRIAELLEALSKGDEGVLEEGRFYAQ